MHTGCGTDTAADLHWCNQGSLVWNNDGDTVYLEDPGRQHLEHLPGLTRSGPAAPLSDAGGRGEQGADGDHDPWEAAPSRSASERGRGHVATCGACGSESAAGSAFCTSCGETMLTGEVPVATGGAVSEGDGPVGDAPAPPPPDVWGPPGSTAAPPAPAGHPTAPPTFAVGGPAQPPGAAGGSSSRRVMAIVAVVAVLLVGAVGVAAFVVTGGDDDLVASTGTTTDEAEPEDAPDDDDPDEDDATDADPKGEEQTRTTVAEDDEAEVFDPGAAGPSTVYSDELVVGHCVVEDLGFLLTDAPEFTVIDCAQPHRAEMFHTFEVLDGPYPGEEVLGDLADDRCAGTAFSDYVGSDFGYSQVWVTTFFPAETSWNVGARDVQCFATEEDESVLTTLSYRNSGR